MIHLQKEFYPMIPTSALFDQPTLLALLKHDPMVQDYRAFFSTFDWSPVEHWQTQRSFRGRPAHPISAFLKAFLLRIREGFIYTSQLRAFLVKHPLLVIELGFRLVLDPTKPYGFDVEQTLPTRFWLGERLRCLDRALLRDLLTGTVHALQDDIPGLGEVVSFDVKHTRQQLVMGELPQSRSTSTARCLLLVWLMALPFVPSACLCIQQCSSTTPMATAPHASRC